MIEVILLYLVLGCASGVVAGLFGIGGGVLIVPVLIIAFTLQGVSPDVLTHTAVATSLATIVVTSISSVITHHQKGAVDWNLVKWLTPSILIGSYVGVHVAASLDGESLQTYFGFFALLAGLQMFFALQPKPTEKGLSKVSLSLGGLSVGGFSVLFGIGGGTINVPFLTWGGVLMQRAVATAAACGLPIAVVGALTNVYTGWGKEGLPEWSVGYVYLPAFLGIVITSTFFARYGALLAHRLPARVLKRSFAVFLLSVSAYLLIKNLV
ncbi:MAG: sulfite exporter TauE/SafE family protein [Pontibacterium sp.]